MCAAYLNQAYKTTSAGYVFSGVAMVLGGLLFYVMPFFERHSSNHVIVQKQSSVTSTNMTAEAAALLDLDLTEGAGSCKAPNHVQCVLAMRNARALTNGKEGSRGGGGQAGVAQPSKERERNGSKASVLSKITEEKDGSRCSAEPTCGATSCSRGNNSLERHARQGESGEMAGDGPSDSTFSNTSKAEKWSGRDSASNKTMDSKKSKKSEPRVDLFDPPSQEKESTATVSYDSDLYINLCEAQV